MTSAIEKNQSASAQANQHTHKRENSWDSADMFSKYLDHFRRFGSETKIDGGAGNDTIEADGFSVKIDGGVGG